MGDSHTADVLVIGAGLAGCCTAHALARRGLVVALVEAAPGPALKASGNRYGLLTPYITTSPSPLETLYSTGFHFSRGLLSSVRGDVALFHAVGAIQLPSTNRLHAAHASSAPCLGGLDMERVSSAEASKLSGIRIESPAFFSRQAGFISPKELVEALVNSQPERIRCFYGQFIGLLQQTRNGWSAQSATGETFSAPTTVICAAYEASRLDSSAWLPLEPIRGQTVSIGSTPDSRELKTIIAFGGYLTPAVNGSHFLGAHYRHHDDDHFPRDSDTLQIVSKCTEHFPNLGFNASKTSEARVCFRTSTLDRLPYIGGLPDFESMRQEAQSLRSGSDIVKRVPMRSQQGLFVNLGHGSRGLLSCPMGGEIIARLVVGEALEQLELAARVVDPHRVPYRLLARLEGTT
jgi:tRNA 5-methylaminomethyl-2-thiouridine biosynthesis bifunctional protein